MSPSPSQLDLKFVAGVMTGVAALESQDLGLPEDKVFLEQAAVVRAGMFRLVVMGEIKKGKSSFINALCGVGRLVPVHAEVATSTIFEIRHGPRLKLTVHFIVPEGEPVRTLEIQPMDVDAYGSENGNPGNVKRVAFIAIEAPAPLLSTGLVIVDTPGVGGVIQEHRQITFRHAPNADGVFFVVDSVESPIGAQETDFLRDLGRITGKIYFVQTKADLVDEESALARRDNNIAILVDSAGFETAPPGYYIVSSALKNRADRQGGPGDLAESGFIPLLDCLNLELKEGLDRSIASVALARAKGKLRTQQVEIAWRRKVLEADSAEKRTALASELKQLSARLENWQMRELPVLKRDFASNLGEVIRGTQDQLHQALSCDGEIFQKTSAAVSRQYDADDIYNSARRLFSDARSAASFQLLESYGALERDLKNLVTALEDKVRSQAKEYFESQGAADRLKKDDVAEIGPADEGLIRDMERHVGESSSYTVRRPLSGFKASLARGAKTVGGWVDKLLPGFKRKVDAYIETVWETETYVDNSEEDAATAKGRMLAALRSVLGSLQMQAEQRMDKLKESLRVQAEEALNDILTTVTRTLHQRRQVLDQRGQETVAQLAELSARQLDLEVRAAKFMNDIEALEPLTLG